MLDQFKLLDQSKLEQLELTVRAVSRATETNKASSRDDGFTLTELLVVLVILAMLTAIIAPNMIGRLGSSRTQTARVQIENLAGALEIFLIDVGRYPTEAEGLSVLVTPPAELVGWSGPYLRRGGVPDDPWGREYVYSSSSPDEFTLSTLGRDGVEGGSGEDADVRTSTILGEIDA